MTRRRPQARRNPLMAKPPVVGTHRGGSEWVKKIQRTFSWFLREHPNAMDVYWGVSVTCESFAAMGYALNYRKIGDNDWGVPDVTNPAVLLALKELPPDKLTNLDVDLLGTAMVLLSLGTSLQEDVLTEFGRSAPEEWDDVTEYIYEHEGFREMSHDHGRTVHYDAGHALEEYSLGGVSGDFSVRAEPDDLLCASLALVEWSFATEIRMTGLPATQDLETKRVAIELAAKLIPQRRYLGNISEEHLGGFIVVPGFGGALHGDELDDTVEMSDFVDTDRCQSLDPRVVFTSFDDLAYASRQLLDVALDLGCVFDARGQPITRDRDTMAWKWWHGTNFERAASAFPAAFPAARKEDLIFAGSYRCAPEWGDENEDEDAALHT